MNTTATAWPEVHICTLSCGDIVGMPDANGSLIAEYNYNAWCKPTAVTGSMADNPSALDPSGIAYMSGMRRRALLFAKLEL